VTSQSRSTSSSRVCRHRTTDGTSPDVQAVAEQLGPTGLVLCQATFAPSIGPHLLRATVVSNSPGADEAEGICLTGDFVHVHWSAHPEQGQQCWLAPAESWLIGGRTVVYDARVMFWDQYLLHSFASGRVR
jgi:hypothetical protein